jgi:two-component system LytT family response regulator
MSPLKAIIIEDEVPAQKRLSKLLEAHEKELIVIDVAGNGEEGLELIEKHSPDVIFLDIEMPVMSGLEMLAQLKVQPLIIFTTAYDEYALQSFEENSIDYLLKPVRKERLQKAISKLCSLRLNREGIPDLQNLQRLIERMNTGEELKMIKVTKGDRIIFIKLTTIQYFMAEEKLTKIIDHDSKQHFIHPSLKQLESRLPGNFVQISRSCIINESFLKEVRKIFQRKLMVEMANGHKIPIGSGYLATLKERWSL